MRITAWKYIDPKGEGWGLARLQWGHADYRMEISISLDMLSMDYKLQWGHADYRMEIRKPFNLKAHKEPLQWGHADYRMEMGT